MVAGPSSVWYYLSVKKKEGDALVRVFSLSLCRTFHRLMDAVFKRLCNKGRERVWHPHRDEKKLHDRPGPALAATALLLTARGQGEGYRERGRKKEERGSTAPLSTTTRGAFSLKRSMPCCSRVESAKHGSAASLPFCSLRNGSGSFPRPRLPSA